MIPIGTIVLERDGEVSVTLTPARARPQPVRYDARLARAPFGTAWFVVGTRTRALPRFMLTTEVTSPDGITAASDLAHAVVTAIERAERVLTPYARIESAGVTSVTVTPIELGYRVDAEVVGWQVFVLPVMAGGSVVMAESSEVVAYA
jgi:hypothetical protein